MKKNPLEDPRSLADRVNIEYVMQGGRFGARQFAVGPGILEDLMAGAWVCCGM